MLGCEETRGCPECQPGGVGDEWVSSRWDGCTGGGQSRDTQEEGLQRDEGQGVGWQHGVAGQGAALEQTGTQHTGVQQTGLQQTGTQHMGL